MDERRQQHVVVLCEQVEQPVGETDVGRAERPKARAAGAALADRAHRDDLGGEPLGDALQHAVVPRAAAVDLVDEEERWYPQALQRPHQDAGLRLHPFHRGQDEHRAV